MNSNKVSPQGARYALRFPRPMHSIKHPQAIPDPTTLIQAPLGLANSPPSAPKPRLRQGSALNSLA